MSGYIAIPTNKRMTERGCGSIHFESSEELRKAFGLTEGMMRYLIDTGAQPWRGYFFDEEI